MRLQCWVFLVFTIMLGNYNILLSLSFEAEPMNFTMNETNINGSNSVSSIINVKVFYFILPHWDTISISGDKKCTNSAIHCNWIHDGNVTALKEYYHDFILNSYDPNTITVAVYNIHSLWEKFRVRHPINCEWRTNFTLATSEESTSRFGDLFHSFFHNFDGNSTTNPDSSVQRIYAESYLGSNEEGIKPNLEFYDRAINFSALIKGASFVARYNNY